MKAITYSRYGSPDVLKLRDVDQPQPKANELLIKVCAAEATKGDCELRSFQFAIKWFWLPLRLAIGVFKPRRKILGSYFSGEIVSVGQSVTRFKPGDEIFGCARLKMGAYAEFVCLPEHFPLVIKPENLTFPEAASVPLGGLNALHFMRRAKIRPGDKLLVLGAGGSIGSYAVQIAKAWGAKVTAVDSGIKQSLLHRLGADVFIDYQQQSVLDRGESFDIIFNMVANSSYSKCIEALNPGGRYLMGNPRFMDMIRSVVTTRFSDKRVLFAFAAESIEELQTLKSMLENNEIKPVVDEVFPLAEMAEAHRRVEQEQRLGPVVVAIVKE